MVFIAGDDASGRSSLIGVAISLSGNVLISLALNCQKLAHIRLQQQEEGDSNQSPSTGKHGKANGNGTDEEPQGSERQGLLDGRQTRGNGQYGATSSSAHDEGSYAAASSRQRDADLESGRQQGTDKQDSSSGSQFKTDFLKSRLWWLGIGLMTLGEFGNFLSYGFAPASLVAPLGAVALLANVIFSPILLKERFRLSDLGGILLAIVGAVTVVFSSKQSDASLDPDELWEAICRTEFIAYAATAAGLVVLLAWGSSTRLGDRYILLDVGVCALFGGFTVLSTKGLSSLVSQMGPFELLRFPISYGLIAVLVGTALAQITYLNRALQRFDSREVIPTQFVLFTISAIVGSAILYQDFKDTDARQLINFLFGCATTFLGVFLLTKSRDDDDNNDEEYDDYGAEEDTQSIRTAEGGQQSHDEERGPPRTPNQGVRIAKDALVPPSARRRRTFGGGSGPSLAAVPVSVPGGRLGGGLFGPAPRRIRHKTTNSGASLPTVSMRRGSAQSGTGAGSATVDSTTSADATTTTAAVPSDVPAIASTSYQEARSMPVLYTRRSIFNPAFSITYVAPPPLSTRTSEQPIVSAVPAAGATAAPSPLVEEQESIEPPSAAQEQLSAASARLHEQEERSP